MSRDTSTKALEANDVSNSNRPNFLVAFAVLIFVMITATSSLFFFSSRLRSMFGVDLNGLLSSAYDRDLYDRGYKTLMAVLKSASSLLYPKSNHTGGKSRRKGRGKGKSRGKGRGRNRSKAKQKAVPPQLTGYRSLLVMIVMIVVLCIVGSGEASWFGHDNNSEAAEGMNEVLDNGVVKEVSIEVS